MSERFRNGCPTSKWQVPGVEGWFLEASSLDVRTVIVSVRREFPAGAWQILSYTQEAGYVFSGESWGTIVPLGLCLHTYRRIADQGGISRADRTVVEARSSPTWAEVVDGLPGILAAGEVLLS